MNIETIYKKLLQRGNAEISNLTTRCLLADARERFLYVDRNRLLQELKLYRIQAKKDFQSILSSLIPIVIANPSIEKSYRGACELFSSVRKKITIQNKIGLNLLCHYLYHLEDFEQFFADYKMIDGTKEDELALQKEKIEIILNKKTVEQSIVECLEEQVHNKNIVLLESLRADEKVEADEIGNKMAAYLQKLSLFQIAPRPFEGEFKAGVLSKKVGSIGQDDLIGQYRVKGWDEEKAELILETKRGMLTLRLNIGDTQKSSAANKAFATDPSFAANQGARTDSVTGENQDLGLLRRFGTHQLEQKWKDLISEEMEKEYFFSLLRKVDRLYSQRRIFPKQDQVFRALSEVDYDQVRVVIIGQDPYHGAGQANGLCFSVNQGVKAPPSLVNIFKELEQEFGQKRENVDLSDWAKQGVLLLNAVLTVQEGAAGSHAKQGWEIFTDRVIAELNKREVPMVFILWGNYAAEKAKNVDVSRHLILRSNHPSPLSCHRGFFGNRHFILANEFLRKNNLPEVVWI